MGLKVVSTRWSFFSSLRVRLTLLVLLAILPALALMLQTAAEISRSEAERVQHDVQAMTDLAVRREEHLIEGVRQLLIALARLPAVRSSPSACNELMAELLNQYEIYLNLGAIATDGTWFCSARPLDRPLNSSTQPWFQQVQQTQDFAIGQYQIEPITEKAALYFAYPVLDSEEHIVAIMVAVLNLESFDRLINEVDLPEEAILMEIDRAGTILSRQPNPEKWIGQTLSDAPIIETILAQDNGIVEVAGIDGVTRLYAFAPLRNNVETGLYLTVGIPTENAFTEVDQIWLRNLLIVGLVGLLALVVAWFGGDIFILRRVKAVIGAARRLQAGELEARTNVAHAGGEINQLAQTFDEMAEALEQREAELKQATQALEAQHAFLRQVIDLNPNLIFAKDRAGRFTLANQAVAQVYGTSVEDLLGKTDADFNPDSVEVEHFKHDDLEVIESGREKMIPEEFISDAQGQTRWLQTVKRPLTDSDGRVSQVLGVAIDITMRKQAQEALQESNTILQAIIEGTNDAIFVKNRAGHYLLINSAGARIAGRTVAEMIGRKDMEVLPEELGRQVEREDQQVIASGQAQIFETYATIAAEKRTLHSFKTPYRDSEGQIIGIIGVARDITELKRAELAQRLLAEAGRILSGSLDYTARLTSLAQLAVPHLADWCSVVVVEPDGVIRQLPVAHVDPTKVELAETWQRRYPPDWTASTGAANVLRTGQSEIYPDISEAMLEAGARDAEHLQILRQLQIRSAIVVPLQAHENTLGVMTLVWAESGRRYDEDDLALAEELARRAAIAVDNARLFEAQRTSREAAEETARRVSSLQGITAALSESLTADQVITATLQGGLALMQADSGLIALLDETKTNLNIVHTFGYFDQQVEPWRHIPISAPVPLAETARTGEPLFFKSTEEINQHFPGFAQQKVSYHEALVTLPLHVEKRIMGVIGMTYITPRAFSQEERSFMLAVARQCAQALERARLFEAERQSRAEAEAAQQQLALLAEVRERNRLAQELHDNIAQAVGYLNLKIGQANMQLAQGALHELKANLQELKQMVAETYTDVREEIFDLRSDVIRETSFLDTLHQYIKKYKKFYKLDIQLCLEAAETLFEFPPEVSIQLIRIIQEALINVRKHAQISEVVIRLGQREDRIFMRVEDQGQGFDLLSTTGKQGSFGLQIMRERAQSIGGDLEIQSAPGQGTSLVIWLPRGHII